MASRTHHSSAPAGMGPTGGGSSSHVKPRMVGDELSKAESLFGLTAAVLARWPVTQLVTHLYIGGRIREPDTASDPGRGDRI